MDPMIRGISDFQGLKENNSRVLRFVEESLVQSVSKNHAMVCV